jgi:hypothetical protein
MVKHVTYKTIFNNNSEGGDKWQKNTYKILNGTLSFQKKFIVNKLSLKVYCEMFFIDYFFVKYSTKNKYKNIF